MRKNGERYAAFLRAINVGNRIVKMEVLKRIFDSFSIDDVETFITSGNVLFRSSNAKVRSMEEQFEAGLKKALLYEVPVFVRSAAEIKKILLRDPFRNSRTDSIQTYVTLLRDKPSKSLIESLYSYRSNVDEFEVDGRELYLLVRKNEGKSLVTNMLIEKKLKMAGTTRNMNTIARIHEKFQKEAT